MLLRSAKRDGEPQFHLMRRFGAASLVVIAAIAIANALVLSNFVTGRLLDREAQVTMDFVQNVLQADGSLGYLSDPGDARLAARFAESVVHFKTMPWSDQKYMCSHPFLICDLWAEINCKGVYEKVVLIDPKKVNKKIFIIL